MSAERAIRVAERDIAWLVGLPPAHQPDGLAPQFGGTVITADGFVEWRMRGCQFLVRKMMGVPYRPHCGEWIRM